MSDSLEACENVTREQNSRKNGTNSFLFDVLLHTMLTLCICKVSKYPRFSYTHIVYALVKELQCRRSDCVCFKLDALGLPVRV